MSNLIQMEQAATMLGITVEKLNELRSNQEIFGYRDGSTWKFKMSELERVADELEVVLKIEPMVRLCAEEVSEDDFDFGDSGELVLDDGASDDSIELEDSSIELFQSPLGQSLAASAGLAVARRRRRRRADSRRQRLVRWCRRQTRCPGKSRTGNRMAQNSQSTTAARSS